MRCINRVVYYKKKMISKGSQDDKNEKASLIKQMKSYGDFTVNDLEAGFRVTESELEQMKLAAKQMMARDNSKTMLDAINVR